MAPRVNMGDMRTLRKGDRVTIRSRGAELTGEVLGVALDGYSQDCATVRWEDGRRTHVRRDSTVVTRLV